MEFQDNVNAVLIPLTHYFTVMRLPDLAIANILALVMLNMTGQRDKYFLMVNGIFTYLMGYIYFFEQRQSSGVYMFLLGAVCIGTSVADTLRTIYQDWNERFRIQKEVEYESESEENEEEDEEEDEGEENGEEGEEEALLSSEAPNPTSSVSTTRLENPEPSVEAQTTSQETSSTQVPETSS